MASMSGQRSLKEKSSKSSSVSKNSSTSSASTSHMAASSYLDPSEEDREPTDSAVIMEPSTSAPASKENQPAFEEAAASAHDEEDLISILQLTTTTTLTLQDDDVFEDAGDEDSLSEFDLQLSFIDCHAAITRFFENDLRGATAIMRPLSNVSLYHSLGQSIFEFIPAMLTFDKILIANAKQTLKKCIRLCDSHRRTITLTESLGSIVRMHNYASWTDLQAHAELCYAEALLLKVALTIVDGKDYSSYVLATLQLKDCYRAYKACWYIKERKQWETEESKIHFDSGVRLGTATFNLMVSLLPSKLISVLEFVGFSGSKMYGLNELEKGANSPGMRAVLCNLTLLIYHLIVIPFIGGDGNTEAAELIFQKVLVTYPNSVWFLALRARSEFLKGRLKHAMFAYNRAMHSQEHFKQFRNLCYWELMWIHGLNMDFEESAMYAQYLVRENAWSKTTNMYIRAAMLMEIEPCDISPFHLNEIDDAMRLAPLAKVRIAGKSLPMEKFIAKRCERYKQQGHRLVLPGIELLSHWNMIHILKNNKDQLFMLLRIIEKTQETLQKASTEWMGDYVSDNYALVYYLHGCALTAMELPRQATEKLQKVVDLKKSIKEDTFLVPYALCEMALCQYQMGDMQRAMELLHECKKKYSGYSLEMRLHLRVHARIEVVRSVIGASKFTPGIPGIKIKKHFDG